MNDKVESWSWAIDSMASLKIPRVFLFEAEENYLVNNMVTRPRAWPSLRYQPGLLC